MSSHVVLELAALTPLRNMLEIHTVEPHPDLLTQKLWRWDPAIIFNKPSLYDPSKHKNFENQCRWVSGWVFLNSFVTLTDFINVPESFSWICKNEIVVTASKKLKKWGNTKCLAHSRCPKTLDSLIFICEHGTKNNQENNLPQFSSYIMCYVSS